MAAHSSSASVDRGRGRRLPPLVLLLIAAADAYAPTDPSGSDLRTAVGEWCQDAVAAEAKYGAHIRDWDVSRVNSMSNLFMSPPVRAAAILPRLRSPTRSEIDLST